MAGARLPKIRFLLMNAFTVGGTIRTTFTMAGELAKRGDDVEIASVYRMRTSAPALPPPGGVRLRTLTDLRAPTLERYAAGSHPVSRLRHWLVNQPSRLMTRRDFRYHNFSLLTDLNLYRYLASVDDGILIGTRPALNLVVARLMPVQVTRIGQDHMHLDSYPRALVAQIRAAYPRLDLVTALAPETADAYRRLLDDRVAVECLPNAVPDVGSHRADTDAKVVAAAGRLTPQKGFDLLLEAWSEVSEEHPDWELRIFGDGYERERLEHQVEELGLGATVKLPGFTRELHAELSHASVYVLSSRLEGFPMVLVEAMAIGLPAVSFDCPTGPSGIITEGVDGHLVPAGDTHALAAAMEDLMANPDKRCAFGEAARAVRQRYDAGALAERWERTLVRLVAAKGPERETLAGRTLALERTRISRHARRRLHDSTDRVLGGFYPR